MAVTAVGASGTVNGTASMAVEGEEFPATLVATTVNR
jgi:hypothetical protein